MAPPEPPSGLGAAGLAAWSEAWSEAPWLGEVDRALVARFAEAHDEIDTYREAISEHGAILYEPIVTPRGNVVGKKATPNPAVRALRDVGAELLALATALGLSPASRARLGLTVAQTRALSDRGRVS